MIQYGDTKMVPALKRLWKECFADEDSYINAFFDALYDNRNVLLEQEKGVLMGASFFLPGKIYLDGGFRDIRYVYALATGAQFRGRGIAGGLLQYACKAYRAPLVAEPADDGLVGGFYEPLGFVRSFYLKQEQIEIQPGLQDSMPQYDMQAAQLPPSPPANVAAASAEQYCSMRDLYFCRQGYVSWPLQHVAFAIDAHRGQDGEALYVTSQGREDILLYYVEGRKAVVTETTLGQAAVADILSERQPGISSIIVKHAMPYTGQGQPGMDGQLVGMAYGFAPIWGYLNLSLD